MQKGLRRALFFGMCAAVSAVIGCGGGGGGADKDAGSTPVAVAGKVVQGPVRGAVVFADRNGNRVLDKGEASTRTDKNGRYAFTIPYADYVLVSDGGIDTLTGEFALPLLALPGAQNITPLTTLVAASADPKALREKIEKLGEGQSYDLDLSAGAVPAGYMKASKGVETALRLLDRAGVNEDQVKLALAKRMAESLHEWGDLTDEALAQALGAAVSSSAADMKRDDLEVIDVNRLGEVVTESISAVMGKIGSGAVIESDIQPEVDEHLAGVALNGVFKKTLMSGKYLEISDGKGNVLATYDRCGLTATVPSTVDTLTFYFAAESTLPKRFYNNLSLVFVITDKYSERMATFDFGKIMAFVDGTNISFDCSAADLRVKGVTAAGNRVSATLNYLSPSQLMALAPKETSLQTLYPIRFDLGEIQKALAAEIPELAEVTKPGSYYVTFSVKGMPAAARCGSLVIK